MSKQLKIKITSTVRLPSDWVRMMSVDTGEVKYYSDIDPKDIKNWYLFSSAEVIGDATCFDYEADETIKITELED